MRSGIIYSSGIAIWDRSDLATLSVFYDKVWLPAAPFKSRGAMAAFVRPKGSKESFQFFIAGIEGQEISYGGKRYTFGSYLDRWEENNTLLYREGVLNRFEPDRASLDVMLDLIGGPSPPELIKLSTTLLDFPMLARSVSDDDEFAFIYQDHLAHLVRTDLSYQTYKVHAPGTQSLDRAKALMARKIFTYLMPCLPALEPDLILELRRSVEKTREGFSMHLQQLMDKIESIWQPDVDSDELEREINRMVQSSLIPAYAEFKRKIEFEQRRGVLCRIGEGVGKFLEIDAGFWTPKFWGGAIKAILPGVEDYINIQKSQLDNKNQAMQFMRKLDRPDARP